MMQMEYHGRAGMPAEFTPGAGKIRVNSRQARGEAAPAPDGKGGPEDFCRSAIQGFYERDVFEARVMSRSGRL
jgi:hypothetical protein